MVADGVRGVQRIEKSELDGGSGRVAGDGVYSGEGRGRRGEEEGRVGGRGGRERGGGGIGRAGGRWYRERV